MNMTPQARVSLVYNGRRFYPTGKTGRRFDTGLEVSEYQCREGRVELRVWLDEEGTVYED